MTKQHGTTIEELVQRAWEGDAGAFDVLIAHHTGLVHAIALARLRNVEAAEDLAQEVFLRVWMHIAELRQPRFFSAWISRIARNLATDWARRGQTNSRLLPLIPLDNVTDALPDRGQCGGREMMAEREEQSLVGEAIGDLPPDLAEVVLLHTAEGLTHSEIARQLNLYPSTVMRRWRKALTLLRGILEPQLREEAPSLQASTKLAAKTSAVIAGTTALSDSAKGALLGACGGTPFVSSVIALPLLSAITKGSPVSIAVKAVSVSIVAAAVFIGAGRLTQRSTSAPSSETIDVRNSAGLLRDPVQAGNATGEGERHQRIELARPSGESRRVDNRSIDQEPGEMALRQTPESGVINGRAVGIFTQQPIPNALIVLRAPEGEPGRLSEAYGPEFDEIVTETDREGRFRFEGIPIRPIENRNWIITSPGRPLVGDGYINGTFVSPDHPSRETTVRLPEHFSVSGTVIHADTREPVPNLEFEFISHFPELSQTATTDDQGHFTVESLLVTKDPQTGGTQQIQAVISDDTLVWAEAGPIIDISFNDGGDLSEFSSIQLEVERGLPLTVTTLDPQGNPIAEAQVFLTRPRFGSFRGSAVRRLIGSSDENGNLSVLRSPCYDHTRIFATHAEWPLIMSPEFTNEDSEVTAQAVPVVPISVHVTDSGGNDIRNAWVYVTTMMQVVNGSDGCTVAHGTTDRNGMVRFERVTELPVTITGQSHIGTASAQINLSSGDAPEVVNLRIEEPEPQVVMGRVVDVAGNPISGAHLVYGARLVSHSPSSPIEAFSDDAGGFSLTLEEQGFRRYELTVTAPGYADGEPPTVESRGNEIVVTLFPEVILSGRLALTAGTSTEDLSFTLWTPTVIGHRWRPTHLRSEREITFEDDHRFSISTPPVSDEGFTPVYPRPAWIMVSASDRSTATANFEMDVEPGQRIDLGTLTMQSGMSVEARVVDPLGTPLQDAHVGVAGHWEANTDAEGHFQLAGLPEGAWHLNVNREDFHQATFLLTLPGSVTPELTIRPLENETLTIHVLGLDGQPAEGVEVRTMISNSRDQLGGITDTTGTVRVGGMPHGNLWVITRLTAGDQIHRLEQHLPVGSNGLEHTFDFSNWHRIELETILPEVTPAENWQHMIITQQTRNASEPRASIWPTPSQEPTEIWLPSGQYRAWWQQIERTFEVNGDGAITIDFREP